MDVFEAFPQLSEKTAPVMAGRSLRLIAVSGIVYDESAFYFELGQERFWARTPENEVTIGVSAPKVRPESALSPLEELTKYLQKVWRCKPHVFLAGHSYVLDIEQEMTVLTESSPGTPYLFVLTPPRLGGGEMPDALVQAVYLMPVERWLGNNRRTSILEVERTALEAFLEPERWRLAALEARSWATLRPATPLPVSAFVRPVLALRGLRTLWRKGALSSLQVSGNHTVDPSEVV